MVLIIYALMTAMVTKLLTSVPITGSLIRLMMVSRQPRLSDGASFLLTARIIQSPLMVTEMSSIGPIITVERLISVYASHNRPATYFMTVATMDTLIAC